MHEQPPRDRERPTRRPHSVASRPRIGQPVTRLHVLDREHVRPLTLEPGPERDELVERRLEELRETLERDGRASTSPTALAGKEG